jgi:hypothetical protein
MNETVTDEVHQCASQNDAAARYSIPTSTLATASGAQHPKKKPKHRIRGCLQSKSAF